MPENELGATLVLRPDQEALAATKKALAEVTAAQATLAKANLLGAEAANEQAIAEAKLNKENLLGVDIARDEAEALRKAAAAAAAQAAATKSVVDVVKELDRQKSIDDLATKWAKVAKETRDADAAAKGLQKDLEALNATQPELRGAAGAFAAQSDEGGGTFGSKLQGFGSKLRALPSVQIPGLNIGSDSVANILRVSGAIAEKLAPAAAAGAAAAEGAAAANTALGAAEAAAGAEAGAASVGFGALIASLLPFAGPVLLAAAALGVMAAAVKSFVDEQAKQQAQIEGIIDAQRAVGQQIANGATSKDIETALDKQKQLRQDEIDRLGQLNPLYKEQIENAQLLGLNISGVVKAISGTEEGLSNEIQTSLDNIDKYTFTIDAQTEALESGKTAANDMIALEMKLAEERTKAALQAADNAGREIAAKNKALNATTEQNEARLKSIEEEKQVIQAQLDALSSSGDTSDEVKARIASLNNELQELGKESSFIQDTALNVSKLNDRKKELEKEIEKNDKAITQKEEQVAQKRHDAAVKYSDALIDIATKAADAAEDALTKLQDNFAKQQVDFDRDINDLSVKANRKRAEDELKAHEDEARDLRQHQHNLEAIRDKAIQDELGLLRKRDFLAAALVREKANQDIEAQNKNFTDAQSEQNIAAAAAHDKELRELENARNDRLLALQRQNEDARTAYDNDLRNADIAAERAAQQANVNRQRELRTAQETADEVLKIKEQQAELEKQLAQTTLDVIAAMANATQSQPTPNGFGGNSSNVTTNNNQRSIGNVNIPIQTTANASQMRQITIRTLGELGLVG